MIALRRRVVLTAIALLVLAVGLVLVVCAAQPPSRIPKYSQWKLVAQSDLILRATLAAPVDAIRASLAGKKYAYLPLRARVMETLKGRPGATEIEIQYYTAPAFYSPSPQVVINHDGKRVLLFLVRVDGPGTAGLYFAGYTPQALQASDEATVRAVRAEVRSQQRILAAYPGSTDARPDAHQKEVHALIEQLVSKRTQMAAVNRLGRLGQAAVPSMIRSMDDRRPLAIPYIALRNRSPHAFEEYAQYAPALVVDLVATLLGYIAGQDFGDLENGGSERERARTVGGWRIYLHYRLARLPASVSVQPWDRGRADPSGDAISGEFGASSVLVW